jgi:hypothetical protein
LGRAGAGDWTAGEAPLSQRTLAHVTEHATRLNAVWYTTWWNRW